MIEPREVSGSTRLYGVAGDPVAHSLSPSLHNAVFAALGIDAVSVAFRANESAAALVVAAVRGLGVRGLSVTMPLKAAVVAHCEQRSTRVATLGAANCLVAMADGAVRAESTDGEGLLGAIACSTRVDVDGARCAVLGTGGAARAAVEALGAAGAREIVVIGRREDAAIAAASMSPAARPGAPHDALEALVVVQATPVGMEGTPSALEPPLVDGGALSDGQVAVELVYHPRVTPWLDRAVSAGASPVGGIEVLVHQAAAALSLWLDADVPLAALHAAVTP